MGLILGSRRWREKLGCLGRNVATAGRKAAPAGRKVASNISLGLKLMHYDTVRAGVMKLVMNLPYIIVQLPMQYENCVFKHLGAIGVSTRQYTSK